MAAEVYEQLVNWAVSVQSLVGFARGDHLLSLSTKSPVSSVGNVPMVTYITSRWFPHRTTLTHCSPFQTSIPDLLTLQTFSLLTQDTAAIQQKPQIVITCLTLFF